MYQQISEYWDLVHTWHAQSNPRQVFLRMIFFLLYEHMYLYEFGGVPFFLLLFYVKYTLFSLKKQTTKIDMSSWRFQEMSS